MLTNVSEIFELITALVSYCFTFVSVLRKKEQNKDIFNWLSAWLI